MDFFTTSSFRVSLADLTKRSKDGYQTVVKDICDALQSMSDDILRNTNDRVYQYPEYRVVKLRLPNTGQNLSRPKGFRLIYYVSLKHDNVVLLRVYPKRGPKSAIYLTKAEYTRLQNEAYCESDSKSLHQVDITHQLAELSVEGSLHH